MLVELAGDRDERARLGRAARARVAAEFGVERFRAGVAAAYDAALPSATPPGPAAGDALA